MNFFKKLFSKPKVQNEITNLESQDDKPKEIISEEYFGERYTLQNLKDDQSTLDGCLKIIEGYFVSNKIERRVETPINHPSNLDQTIDEGFGFKLYCQAFQFAEREVILFLALAFSDFLIQEFGFKLYQDSEPEYPLRGMTLKYDKDGVLLSIYPFEYSAKVINDEDEFENLYEKIKTSLGNYPSQEDLLNQL